VTQFLVSGDQYVPVCKISGLCVQWLRFVTPFKVTDRRTDRQTDPQTDGLYTEYMNSSAGWLAS